MPVPLPPTPHTAKISLGWFLDGQQMENIFYLRDPSDGIFSDPVGLLNAIIPFVVSDLLPHMFADIVFNQIGFEDVRTVPFGGVVLGVPGTPAGGMAATGPMPTDVTLAIKKETGNLGRSGRGRWYWASMDPSILASDNIVTTAFGNAITAALFTFLGHVEGIHAGYEWGIVSYYLNKVLRSTGLFQKVIATSLTDYVCDNQRKRLPGRGR